MRHVVEPEVNLFTSASTVDEQDVFIYDEQVDHINDITAAQLAALHNSWQTKRGGPGRWQSVDFLTINVEGNFTPIGPRILTHGQSVGLVCTAQIRRPEPERDQLADRVALDRRAVAAAA